MPLPHRSNRDDEELLSEIAAGSGDALVLLFRRYRAEVHRFALHMSGSRATAEDVTQDVFVVVMRDAARFDATRGTAALPWLLGIARNLVRRRLVRDRMLRPLGEAQDEYVCADTVDPDEDLQRAQQIATIRRAVMTLPVRYREVVLLCDLEELSYQDAAAALDCAVGTVRSRLHRARTLLAAKLGKGSDERKPAIALA